MTIQDFNKHYNGSPLSDEEDLMEIEGFQEELSMTLNHYLSEYDNEVSPPSITDFAVWLEVKTNE